MKYLYVICGLCLALAQVVHAADKKRNGGDVIVCGDTYEVFDLYEARQTYGYGLNLPEGSTYQDIAAKLIARLDAHEMSRANLYRSYLKSFAQEARFLSNTEFTNISDVGEGVAVPSQCQLVQAVSQLRQVDLKGLRYLINKDIWNKLNIQNQAILVLHEIIYREAYADNHAITDSIGVRMLNAYIQSSLILKSSVKEYITTIQSAGLQTVEYVGYKLRLHSGNSYSDHLELYPVTFFDNNTVESAVLGTSLTVPQLINEIACLNKESARADSIAVRFSSENGKTEINSQCIMTVNLMNPHMLTLGSFLTQSILLEANLDISSAVLAEMPASKELRNFSFFSSQAILNSSAGNQGSVQFWPNGNIKYLNFMVRDEDSLRKSTFKIDQKSGSFSLYQETQVRFSPEGKALGFFLPEF